MAVPKPFGPGTGSSEGVKGAMAEESKSEIDAEAEGPGCTAPARVASSMDAKKLSLP